MRERSSVDDCMGDRCHIAIVLRLRTCVAKRVGWKTSKKRPEYQPTSEHSLAITMVLEATSWAISWLSAQMLCELGELCYQEAHWIYWFQKEGL